MKFDPTQERLNNLGMPSVIPAEHSAQTPKMQEIGLHYIELVPDATTPLGDGLVLFESEETRAGGNSAINFDKLPLAKDGDAILSIDLSTLPPGTYNWIRASVAFQNYELRFNISDIPTVGDLTQQNGVILSFIGYNTYIKKITPRTKPLTVNGNRLQGFWAFESDFAAPNQNFNKIMFGQAPVGATTVVNPLFDTSPIPAGSCVITGRLEEPLVITGTETEDMTIVLSFSINNSLEWVDDNDNGQLDFYATGNTPNEAIVDMGVRGLVALTKK